MHYVTTHKKTTSLVIATIATLLFVFIFFAIKNQAANAAISGWDPGNIVSDYVFTNKSTMNASGIQSFLNAKVPNCDTYGEQTSEYGGGTRRQWAEARGYSPPYTCLRNYSENGKSAAQIIYDTAQAYSINPQVLLVLLQKEQGLVLDEWPLSIQYRSATGYGCPDTAACDTTYYGFTNQVKWAATMFRAIENNSSTWYTPYEVGTNYIQYNPNSSCGGSNVNIQNRATQALYNYTPYQPNQDALNAASISGGSSTVSCGAYGNLNFYIYFTRWFGSTRDIGVYRAGYLSQGLYSDSARTNLLPYTATLEPGQTVYLRLRVVNTGNQTWTQSNVHLATAHPLDRTSAFRNSDWISRNRAAKLVQTEVKPGGLAIFETSITAPSTVGYYKEYFNIVVDGITWMNDLGVYYPILVEPARYATVYSDSSRSSVIGHDSFFTYTGEKYYGSIKIKNNTGATIPANTRLATSNPLDRTSNFYDSSWISSNRIAPLGKDLQPGETGTINFILSAPPSTGSFTESFGLVIDGTGGRWVETNTATLTIDVKDHPGSQLESWQSIRGAEQIQSANNSHQLTLQTDGNLVLRASGPAVWASNTVGSGANRLVMQSDGNLVLYAGSKAVWSTRTAGRGADHTVMQSDGNLVLYAGSKAVWATNTANR